MKYHYRFRFEVSGEDWTRVKSRYYDTVVTHYSFMKAYKVALAEVRTFAGGPSKARLYKLSEMKRIEP